MVIPRHWAETHCPRSASSMKRLINSPAELRENHSSSTAFSQPGSISDLGAGSCDVSLTHENSLSTSVNAAGWPRLPTIGTDIAQSTARIARSRRDLAIFNLAIDSKLRACDLVKLRLDDICSGAKVRHRATIVKKKTGRPVQFEITEQSRSSVEAWLRMLRAAGSRYLFPSRLHASPHISTRHARLVHRWVGKHQAWSTALIWHALDAGARRPPRFIARTGNLRAQVQLLLGHTKLESAVPISLGLR